MLAAKVEKTENIAISDFQASSVRTVPKSAIGQGCSHHKQKTLRSASGELVVTQLPLSPRNDLEGRASLQPPCDSPPRVVMS